MALFTDAAVVTVDDLLDFETSLVQVASSHGINVSTKIGVATSAIGDEVMFWLLNSGASDPQYLNRRLLKLSTVVVTTPLQRWLSLEALARTFAEAYNVQLNTRFQEKWAEYKQLARDAAELFRGSGIGVVYKPLPKPVLPLVSVQSGTAPGQPVFVQTSWADTNGNESAASPVNGLVLGDNSSIAVAMAEGALEVPPSATGWNVYASSNANDLTRQNSAALAVGSTWQLPASGFVEGPSCSVSQRPDFYIMLTKQIRRG